MNREIKFRAKLLNTYYKGDNFDKITKISDEWHYGYIWVDFLNHAYIIERTDDETDFEQECVLETIGQFTGLLDKNGKEIYEGDKVKALKKFGHFREKGEILEVYWNEKLLQYGLTINSGSYLKHGDCDWLQLTAPKAKYLEVIGNIHEEGTK